MCTFRSLALAAIITATAAPIALAQTADLFVSKSGPFQAAAGADVSYSVTVLNGGPFDSDTVTLTDPVPAGMTYVSDAQNSGPSFTCTRPPVGSGGNIVCTIATLVSGASADFTFVFNIPAATPPGTVFTNTATVSAATFDPNSENDAGTAVTSTPPPPQADMGVAKNGPADAGPGTDVVYTIFVFNAGPDDASNVTLNDPLPGTMTFVSLVQNSGPLMSCTGTITCTASTFPASQTAVFTLTGHVPSGTASGTIFPNTATVSASTTDPNPDNNAASAITTISAIDVSATKSGPAAVTAGTNITYTIVVANAGPDTAGVGLNDPLPANATFVSLAQNNGPASTCISPAVGTNGTVTCTFVSMAAAASAQFTLVINPGNTVSVTNTATATTDGFDTNPANDSSSVTTSITQSAELAVTKSGPATIAAGSNVTYTVTLTNAGPSDATAVSLADALPAGTTFVSASQSSGPAFTRTTPPAGGTGTITCTIAAFPASASATFSFVLALASSTPAGSSISNVAIVTAATGDPNGANNTATTTATATSAADVSVTKTGPVRAIAGSDVTYTVTVANAGPSDAATVSLTDAVPAQTTFLSSSQTSGPAFTCTSPAAGGTGTIACNIATLAAGASATFSFVFHVVPGGTGSVANTATVASPTDTTPANNTATVTITAAADIPALSPLGLMLLALSLAAVALFARVR